MIKDNKISRSSNSLNVEILFGSGNNELQGGGYINNNKSYDDFILIKNLYDKVFTDNAFC